MIQRLRQVGLAHQPLVYAVSRVAPLGDRPHDQTLASRHGRLVDPIK